MITSIRIVAADFNEMATVSFDGVTLETLLEVYRVDYRGEYKSISDVQVGGDPESVFWVRFTHELHTITLHEFHRWEIRESGLTVVRQHRVRAEEEIHE